MKRVILLFCVVCMSALIGCKDNTAHTVTDDSEDVKTKLIYYTIGTPDKDIEAVNDKLNELLRQKMGVEIDYNKIGWNEYGDRLNTMISSGVEFDIAFASSSSQGDFLGNARKGVWLDLKPYFETTAQDLYKCINPVYWEGMEMRGQIFGVPTNKEVAVPLMFMYPKSIVDKYDIDVEQYTTIPSVAPLLEMIKRNEPEYIGLQLDSTANNLFAAGGYEFVISRDIPLVVKSMDPSLEVVNIFETDFCKELMRSLRKYYVYGYINEDAALLESQSLVPNEKVFLRIAEGGPYSDVVWSNDRQYEIVTQQISDAVVTTESTQGGIMVVNSKSKNPDKSVEFLSLVNTDPEIRNLLNFGIEGTHYRLTDEGQVDRISKDYTGVQYTQGNWFILNTVVGEPLDKWTEFYEFNRTAKRSEALGFTPNTLTYQKELEKVKAVWKKYYPYLMTGSVDTDFFLNRFNRELKDAGIEKVKGTLQSQITAWKKSVL